METKKRANSIISTRHDATGITFTVAGVGDIPLPFAELSHTVRERAMVHGLIQRISDAAALSRDPDTGKPATPQAKFDEMARLVAHYRTGTGDWSIRREGGGGESREGGVTLRALANVQKTDVATMREKIERMAEKNGTTTRAILAKLATQSAVAAEIARLKSATVAVDADELLAELGE